MARLLQLMGVAVIIAGIIAGFNIYETEIPVSGYQYLTDTVTSYPVLFLCIAVGVVSGLLLIALGEIIHKQEETKKLLQYFKNENN